MAETRIEDLKTEDKKKKEDKKVSTIPSVEERFDSLQVRLDALHKEHKAVPFTSPIEMHKIYAFDSINFDRGNHKKMVSRGILKFDSINEWADFIIPNSADCLAYQPIKGAEFLGRKSSVWNMLLGLAKEEAKQKA